MLEILNSGQYASPIIVFVNQKKTADMVAKDLHRAGVRNTGVLFLWANTNSRLFFVLLQQSSEAGRTTAIRQQTGAR